MAIERVIRAATAAIGLAGLEMSTQVTQGIAKAREGKLTYDDFVSGWGVVATRWLDLWLSFSRPAFGPLLPAVVITSPATSVAGQSPAGTVYLENPLPAGATPSVTPLVFVGDAQGGIASLPVTVEIGGTDRATLKTTITLAAGPAPPKGLYQGLVLFKDTPIATVAAWLT